MKIYFAPMQGVTGWPLRMTHLRHYAGVDRYYMPFIGVHQTRTMKNAEKRDVSPGHNDLRRMVPQLLPGKAEDTLAYLKMIRDAGYGEVSLNFGCPARTVTSKAKGAGILEDPSRLDALLEKVFKGLEKMPAGMAGGLEEKGRGDGLFRVSVKTRIGMQDTDCAAELIRIYNRYPISEVQVHARLGKDGYTGRPDMETFRRFYEEIRHPVCYNGDVRCAEDVQRLTAEFPGLSGVMIGRGLIADPMLAEKIVPAEEIPLAEGAGKKQETSQQPAGEEELKRLIRFHDDLCSAWYADYGAVYPTLCRMMEIWDYLGDSFPGSARKVKKIRKTRSLEAYRTLAGEIFAMEYCPRHN